MSGERDEWEELVSAALLGTDRRPLPPGDGTAGPGTAEEVLERAAVHTVRTRAGRRLGRGVPLPRAAADPRPPVSPRAAELLAEHILDGGHGARLPEWLELAAASGRRLPPHLLPPVLDRAEREPWLREHAAVLAGPRGRWLAEHVEPRWVFLRQEATGVAGEDAWRYGTAGDRRRFLRGLRGRDPEAARRLLAAAWPREAPGDRAAFIQTFETGLSDDDEPFLEAALDDRHREVRQKAADLLLRLPRSRLAARMAERGAPCLSRDGNRLVAVPPRECDEAAQRDGVRAVPPRGTEPRAWWLRQMIARTPLSVWTRKFHATPEEIVRWRIADHRGEVVMGWVRAAMMQRDPDWALALFPLEPMAELLAILPPRRRDAVAVAFLQANGAAEKAVDVLGGLTSGWSRRLTLAVAEILARDVHGPPWGHARLARLLGDRGDPDLHEQVRRVSTARPVQEAADVLRFRGEMRKELS